MLLALGSPLIPTAEALLAPARATRSSKGSPVLASRSYSGDPPLRLGVGCDGGTAKRLACFLIVIPPGPAAQQSPQSPRAVRFLVPLRRMDDGAGEGGTSWPRSNFAFIATFEPPAWASRPGSFRPLVSSSGYSTRDTPGRIRKPPPQLVTASRSLRLCARRDPVQAPLSPLSFQTASHADPITRLWFQGSSSRAASPEGAGGAGASLRQDQPVTRLATPGPPRRPPSGPRFLLIRDPPSPPGPGEERDGPSRK